MLQRHGVYLRLTLDLMHEQWEPRWPTEVEVRTRNSPTFRGQWPGQS